MQTLPLYHSIRNWFREKRQARRLVRWVNAGKPVPPPHIVKQMALKESLSTYGVRILVETGTFRGDMVEAMRRHVDQVFSIELSETFAQRAVERFRTVSNVEIILGDSGQELEKLVPRLSGPALFWLDGHYSGGTTAHGDEATPIFAELQHVLTWLHGRVEMGLPPFLRRLLLPPRRTVSASPQPFRLCQEQVLW